MLSPIDGAVLSLSSVPDEAFSSGMLGEGFAVKPSGETVLAPAEGVIGTVSENGHAYSIASEIGDLLVHIGVDTVHLEGAFEPMVKPGQMVAAGQTLCRVDFAKTAEDIKYLVKSKINATPKVAVVSLNTLPRSEKKTQRVFDHRGD